MKLWTRNRTLTGAALLCAAFVSTASAEDLVNVDSRVVTYRSTDLDTPQGVRKVYHRIQSAARVVCHMPDPREISGYPLFQECYDIAVGNAVQKIGVTPLTSLHRSKTQHGAAGSPPPA